MKHENLINSPIISIPDFFCWFFLSFSAFVSDILLEAPGFAVAPSNVASGKPAALSVCAFALSAAQDKSLWLFGTAGWVESLMLMECKLAANELTSPAAADASFELLLSPEFRDCTAICSLAESIIICVIYGLRNVGLSARENKSRVEKERHHWDTNSVHMTGFPFSTTTNLSWLDLARCAHAMPAQFAGHQSFPGNHLKETNFSNTQHNEQFSFLLAHFYGTENGHLPSSLSLLSCSGFSSTSSNPFSRHHFWDSNFVITVNAIIDIVHLGLVCQNYIFFFLWKKTKQKKTHVWNKPPFCKHLSQTRIWTAGSISLTNGSQNPIFCSPFSCTKENQSRWTMSDFNKEQRF